MINAHDHSLPLLVFSFTLPLFAPSFVSCALGAEDYVHVMWGGSKDLGLNGYRVGE